MRVHVALSPAEFPGLALGAEAAVVVDVLRATSTVVAACAAGCRRVIPVADPAAARSCAAGLAADRPLLAGEQAGEPIEGFDLGNSPLDYTAERVRSRTIIFTTTNGTRAMLAAGRAAAAAVAALTNVEAAARWALGEARDLSVLCAGEAGAFSLEDAVCAGVLVARMRAAAPGLELSDAALAAVRLGELYESRLDALGRDSHWGRHLAARGRAGDVEACLRLGGTVVVPRFDAGSIVPDGAALTGLAGATHTQPGRRTGPEPTR